MTTALPPYDRLGAAVAATAPDAPPQLVASVMARIHQEERWAAPTPAQRAWPLVSWWRGLAVAVALVLPTGAITVAQASAAALPGSALYPVRVVREQAALTLAPTPTARASLALGYAQDRLTAMQQVVTTHGSATTVVALMDEVVRYDRQAATVRTPWLRPVIATHVALATRACAVLTSDPLWDQHGGRPVEHLMDQRVSALQGLGR